MSDEDNGWPVEICGVIEAIVTTRGPNERWNVAALGLHEPVDRGPVGNDQENDGLVTATTWGHTRTWRNFTERGKGFVQFTRNPVDFVEAALTVREEDEPVLESADAWAHVEVLPRERGTDSSTEWVQWELQPVESTVEQTTVPTIDRGFNAVIDATVVASRLDVPAYDSTVLLDRLAHLEDIVETCGGERERRAFALLSEQIDVE